MGTGLVIKDGRITRGGGYLLNISRFEADCDTRVHVLRGPNGCGKSSLLDAIAGCLPAAWRELAWSGVDLRDMVIARRTAVGVMLLPQRGRVFEQLTVVENIAVMCGVSITTAKEIMRAEFLVPLADRQRVTARFLSKGEQLRLSLAPFQFTLGHDSVRVLALLDEPLSGCSPELATSVCALIAKMMTKGWCVLVAEHESLALPGGMAVANSHFTKSAEGWELKAC